ncbi:M48 family metalloprotease [Streptomyces collinus]|uniref:Zn-dependent protease with chaperone function n=1 Tax=Streptomyces collinus TaxID=42684 RepID=A0AA89QJV5_STRCU|nr:M48 family metalloprotease [Streptomyces collinus]MBB5816785.1 Zn-dependent protease with chaperone function [Streptomyces collinus]WMX61964.1 M48 family metalloprotease [Streptomyces collinus]
MFARALLFCAALAAAAVTIAFPATTSQEKAKSEAYSLCWPGALRSFQLTLPMSPREREILRQAPVWPPQPVPDGHGPALKRYLEEHCPQPAEPRDESRVGLALGILGVGGFVLYWLSPYRQILFRRLLRLRPGSGYRPDLADAVLRLAGDAGVTVHGVWLNADDYTKNAVAFGHWRRRHIELASGMEKLFDEDRGTFEVVVRHELGHIRHRDLDLTHGITALWGAFLVLLAVVFCFAVFGDAAEGAYLLRLSFHLALLACLLYAARNAFLQSRELHADAFAVRGGPTGTGRGDERRRRLDTFFVDLAAGRGGSGLPFATHPALQRRRAVLRHPDLAGELGVWDAALTGCVALLAVNLLLGDSFNIMLSGLRLGFLELKTLRPVYTWLALPLLLPAGAVLGTGIRHTVAAWGGARGGRDVVGRLALLALGLFVGLCAGCALHPSQTFGDRSVQLRSTWWSPVTDALGLGLALTAALTVLALALFALACVAVCGPRVASWWAGAYGVLVTAAWFPTALPGVGVPYVRTVVVGVALLSGVVLPFLRGRPGQPPVPVLLIPEESVTRTEAPAVRGPRLLLAHAVTAATTVGAAAAVARLLVKTPETPLALVAALGLVCYVAVLVGAAAAPHDAEFRRRVRYAVVCLAVGAGACFLLITGSRLLGLMPGVLLCVAAAGVAVAGRISAAAVYAVRHHRAAATVSRVPAPQPHEPGERTRRTAGRHR